MHTISAGVIDGIHRAVDEAERNFKGLVIWQDSEPFSAGANLGGARWRRCRPARSTSSKRFVDRFQQTSMRIKFSLVPVVAAVRGLAFGGGCEFQMHSARTVAALESYIGLVEAGVGLLPAGGGLKEIAIRAAQNAVGGDVFTQLKGYFETVAMAKVSASALEAKEMGLLRPSDVVVFHADELLYVAKNEANALAESGWRPPLPNRQITGRRRCRHCDAEGQPRQHARRPLHLAARHGDRQPHRRHALRRPDRTRLDWSTNNGCSTSNASTSSRSRRCRRRRSALRTR